MPVVPQRPDCRADLGTIHAFLSRCYRTAVQDRQPKLASFSLPIPSLDPLLAMDCLHSSSERHMYLAQISQDRAVIALGTALCHESHGADRFAQARHFVDGWNRQTLIAPDSPSHAAPRFFCSFTFLGEPADADSGFPAACLFVPSWQVSRQGQDCRLTANWVITPDVDIEDLVRRFEEKFARLQQLALVTESPRPFAASLIPKTALSRQTPFQEAVVKALRHISQHRLRKIVLAHAVDITAASPFHISHSLHNLRQRYPDCCTFSVGDGQGSTFIGASPERLLSVHHRRLVTDALAGSAPRGQQLQDDRQQAQLLMNSIKEREEHQFVVDFLVNKLTELGLRPSYGITPSLLRLSNIQHLHTPIHAMVPGDIHPLQLVEALHPTPAVAGVPTEAACEQIRIHEHFDRALYAAPIGWIDRDGNSEFIVGIRSALIRGNRARLYAGAGIVAGSDPQREWAEVHLKLRALSEALV